MHNDAEQSRLEGSRGYDARVLREELRRVEAPEGFAAAVMARLPARSGRDAAARSVAPGGRRVRAGAMAAAALVAMLAVPGYLHERQQEREAAVAAQQFSFAMRVTEETLVAAEDHVAARAGAHERVNSGRPVAFTGTFTSLPTNRRSTR
ncbi:MAG TPA: hypothetical protein VGD62_00030 [Acidobacteriaceae bacterium]